MLGSSASGASMGMSIAGLKGALVGAIAGALANLPAVINSFELDTILQEKIDKAKEVFDDAEIVRATKKEEARNLAATIDNLKKLQQARYSSEEAEKAFIEASNAAFE